MARSCSPRVARYGEAVVFDVTGCRRTMGPPAVITREVSRLAGKPSQVAVAPTVTAAWLLAHARPGTTVAHVGAEATALADVPMGWLGTIGDLDLAMEPGCAGAEVRRRVRTKGRGDVSHLLEIFARWGLRTLGNLAALPEADVRARLGPFGARLHQAARGQDALPFLPMDEAPRFADRVALEWPIDGLEPLAFVLAGMCDRVADALRRADRGAVTIRTRMQLVTRETHERVLHLPTPMADARMLRTLILLDLESHPPAAAIDVVSLDLDVSPGPIVHGALFAPALPQPDVFATLLSRLTALMGAARVGTPAVLDTLDARAVGMGVAQVPAGDVRRVVRDHASEWAGGRGHRLRPVVRRFRPPVAARVVAERSAPVQVRPATRGLAGGPVISRAGPWRTSGGWWALDGQAWDRDEWDVQVVGGTVYRLVRDRAKGLWEIEGVLD